MLYYQPTAEAAHESVRHIMTQVPYGWLVRSVHAWGAQFFIAVVGLHLLTVLFSKAYARPRELTWMTGAVLLLLALGLGFSGYLLPWNELSYYATLVGTQIPGSLPLIGESLVHVLRGGDQVTGATVTRFYAAHVVIVPLAFSGVIALHLLLIQLQGMSVPLRVASQEQRHEEPFLSEFLPSELCLWLVLAATLITAALYWPAELGDKADTLRPAPAGIKPEWYFLFVFQLLKYLPEGVGVFLMVAGIVFLFAVPLLDRRAARQEPSPVIPCCFSRCWPRPRRCKCEPCWPRPPGTQPKYSLRRHTGRPRRPSGCCFSGRQSVTWSTTCSNSAATIDGCGSWQKVANRENCSEYLLFPLPLPFGLGESLQHVADVDSASDHDVDRHGRIPGDDQHGQREPEPVRNHGCRCSGLRVVCGLSSEPITIATPAAM